jgi:hypothetical protein
MTRWEYRLEQIPLEHGDWNIEQLADAGNQEWEAVSMFCDARNKVFVLLKRQQ